MKIKTGQGTIPLITLLAIYSISMVVSLPGLAISPILGELENIFKGTSELKLQMLESLPSFIIIPFILLAGWLSVNVNKKRLLTIGLSIFFVCSMVYLFANTFGLLLFISAILGIGAGMVVPFSTGLIADYFTGKYRTRQLGFVSAITNFTLVIATFLSGVLAGANWHYSFLVYCFSGVSLFFVFFLTPIHTTDNTDPQTPPVKNKHIGNLSFANTKINWPVKLMLFYYFITYIALTIPFNLSIYMQNEHIGHAEASGTLISIFFLSITLPGLLITKIISVLKNNTNFIALLAVATGLLLLIVTKDFALLTIGVVLAGLGYGIMQPIIYDKTANSVQPIHATYALALVMAMNYVAIITYPFIIEAVQALFQRETSSHFPFILNIGIVALFTLFSYFRRTTKTLGMET